MSAADSVCSSLILNLVRSGRFDLHHLPAREHERMWRDPAELPSRKAALDRLQGDVEDVVRLGNVDDSAGNVHRVPDPQLCPVAVAGHWSSGGERAGPVEAQL